MDRKKITIILLAAIFGTILFVQGNIRPGTSQENASVAKASIKVGDKAPELAYQSPEGKVIKLSDLRGKMVLIDFWASWCPPCRRSNPAVVSAYNKYKDSKFTGSNGFTVYSVSLDKNKAAWQKAIKRDNLSWENHVSDLKYWQSEGAAKYGVESIPATFLVDGNGVIVARSSRYSHLNLEKELQKRLTQ